MTSNPTLQRPRRWSVPLLVLAATACLTTTVALLNGGPAPAAALVQVSSASPTRSTSPSPTRSVSPSPTRSVSPSPTRSTSPSPTRSVSPSPTRSSASPATTPSATCGTQAIVFQGVGYCPGSIAGVKATSYGVGAPIVVGAIVDSVAGRTVAIHGGASCPPGSSWGCGAILPSMTVTFATGLPLPAYGDQLQLFGRTTTAGLTPVGFVVVGHCDPYWGEC